MLFVSLALLIASTSSSSVRVRVVFAVASLALFTSVPFPRPSIAPRALRGKELLQGILRERDVVVVFLKRQRERRGSRFREFFPQEVCGIERRLAPSRLGVAHHHGRSAIIVRVPTSREHRARASADVWGARCPRLSPSTRARAAESRRDSRALSRRRVYGYYELRCDETRI